MSTGSDQATAYLATLKRIEQDIAMIDRDTALASIAISLRRIADALQVLMVAAVANEEDRKDQ